jgi:hypothetical protein
MAPRKSLAPLLVLGALLAATAASALYIDPASKCPADAPWVDCSADPGPCATVRCAADTQCVVNSCGER